MWEKKKQHVVPKVYLKWFCNNKWLLNFYDRETWKYKEQRPENVWWIKHFYTIVWNEWEKDFSIEDFFSNEIENDIWNIFQKINKYEDLTIDEKDKLALFVTFQFLRTEVFRNWINKDIEYMMEWNHKIICSTDKYLKWHINKYEEKTWKKFPLTEEEYKNIYKNFEIKATNVESINMMMYLSVLLYDIVRKKNWYFFVAPKNSSFITSDNPFASINMWKDFWPFGSWWFLNKDLWHYIPLTEHICLHFDWIIKDSEWEIVYSKTDRNKMKSYNSLIANCSYRYIIWKDKRLIESIIKRTKIKDKEFYDPNIISWPLWTR
jgi:hypothetical protein